MVDVYRNSKKSILLHKDKGDIYMVGLIIPSSLKYAPFVKYYMTEYDKANIDYEVLSWNKQGFEEDVAHSFTYKKGKIKILNKIFGYLKYVNWVKRICRERKYDRLIVFTLVPAVFLKDFLTKEYKGRYYLDIRDDSPLRKIMPDRMKKVILGAAEIIASSFEFQKWIGREFVISHNADIEQVEKALANRYVEIKRAEGNVNRIMFAGSMLEWEINFELIKLLQNDENFELIYHAPDGINKKKMIDRKFFLILNTNRLNFFI